MDIAITERNASDGVSSQLRATVEQIRTQLKQHFSGVLRIVRESDEGPLIESAKFVIEEWGFGFLWGVIPYPRIRNLFVVFDPANDNKITCQIYHKTVGETAQPLMRKLCDQLKKSHLEVILFY